MLPADSLILDAGLDRDLAEGLVEHSLIAVERHVLRRRRATCLGGDDESGVGGDKAIRQPQVAHLSDQRVVLSLDPDLVEQQADLTRGPEPGYEVVVADRLRVEGVLESARSSPARPLTRIGLWPRPSGRSVRQAADWIPANISGSAAGAGPATSMPSNVISRSVRTGWRCAGRSPGQDEFQVLAGLDIGDRAAVLLRQLVEQVRVDVVPDAEDVESGLDAARCSVWRGLRCRSDRSAPAVGRPSVRKRTSRVAPRRGSLSRRISSPRSRAASRSVLSRA